MVDAALAPSAEQWTVQGPCRAAVFMRLGHRPMTTDKDEFQFRGGRVETPRPTTWLALKRLRLIQAGHLDQEDGAHQREHRRSGIDQER
jgi:hypothetical protein